MALVQNGSIKRLGICLGIFALFTTASLRAAEPSVEQWGIFETALHGPTTGNPFLDVQFSARFSQGDSSVNVTGFYDGDGLYRLRFMPEKPGEWHYATTSNIPALNNQSGDLLVTPPSPKNHGPVGVHATYHFAYADGTPFRPLGTTCYAWTQQGDLLEEQTLETLAASPFNKIRMCVFPQRYPDKTNALSFYPFAGTPPLTWDFSRFNPQFFQHLEKRVGDLRDRGIEAELILFDPYDKGRWGFDRMPAEVDDRYVRYLVSRLAAYRNVWWSLANEYDLNKAKKESDWDRLGQLVQASDPYGHLRSIHNSVLIYDNTKPWVTHASIQNGSAVEDPGRAELYRDVYRKPIVYDEVKYEGDIAKRWGHLSGEELVFRFWNATVAGTYATHGETFSNPAIPAWTSAGGQLQGQSPARLAFLRRILDESPADGIDPIDKWQETNIGGEAGNYYLIYFGKEKPDSWPFVLPKPKLQDGMQFKAEILDTWNMTVTPVHGLFTIHQKDPYDFADAQDRSIALPGRPSMALCIRRVVAPPSGSSAPVKNPGED